MSRDSISDADAKSGGRFATSHVLELAESAFSGLEARGFARRRDLDIVTKGGVNLFFVGENVGFEFGFDVRDQTVGVRVLRVRDGSIPSPSDGGFFSDLEAFLIRHHGYRGGRARRPAGEPPLRASVNAWLDLIFERGGPLLEDRPDSLGTEIYV